MSQFFYFHSENKVLIAVRLCMQYVIESSVNIDNLELAAHGYEGFYARGWVVIKTGENETYRFRSTLSKLTR